MSFSRCWKVIHNRAARKRLGVTPFYCVYTSICMYCTCTCVVSTIYTQRLYSTCIIINENSTWSIRICYNTPVRDTDIITEPEGRILFHGGAKYVRIQCTCVVPMNGGSLSLCVFLLSFWRVLWQIRDKTIQKVLHFGLTSFSFFIR